jgi:hypothetical protein
VPDKTLARVLSGSCDENIRFNDLCGVLEALGFIERIKGSHHVFWKSGVDEILNLQPRGSMAKAYQVKQVRNVIVRYALVGEME